MALVPFVSSADRVELHEVAIEPGSFAPLRMTGGRRGLRGCRLALVRDGLPGKSTASPLQGCMPSAELVGDGDGERG